MSKLIEEKPGARYGHWTVLERAQVTKSASGPNPAFWVCKCDCGTEKAVRGGKLRSGDSQSCGCVRTLPEGAASFNRLLAGWKAAAKRRGYEWQLSREQVHFLTQQPCHYCGVEPRQVTAAHGNTCNGGYLYNGFDRVDNGEGYSPENVVPCCMRCNYAKREMSIDEFEDWFRAVHRHYFLGET